MTDTKNALAEMAKAMDEPVDMASIHDRGLVVLNAQQFGAYQKAQRIIAELAKVRINSLGGPYDENEAYAAISNCRAIAEEGGAK